MREKDLGGDLLAIECCFCAASVSYILISMNTILQDIGRGVRWLPQEKSAAVLKLAAVEILSLRFNAVVNAAGLFAY